MELDLPAFDEERYIAQQRYAFAIHEVGHTAAAYAVGFGMKKKGIVLHLDTLEDNREEYRLEASAHTRDPGRRSRDQKKRESYHQRNIVVAFAGLIAEYRVTQEFSYIDDDVQHIAFSLRELLEPKRRFLRKLIANVSNFGRYWHNFWDLIDILVTFTDVDRDTALKYLNDYTDYTELDEDYTELDEDEIRMEANARLFEILWPLAREAQSIIDHRWSLVEKLAGELLKTGSLERSDIEAMIGASVCEDPNMTELHHPGTVVFQPEYVALLGGDVHCALMLSQLVC